MAEMKYHREKAPLFKSAVLTSIFGPSLGTLVVRSVILLIGSGATVILVVGLLHPASFAHIGSGQESAGSGKVGWKVGDHAPNFMLQTPEGHKLSLRDYRGRPILLNFWYTTCPDCVAEMPTLQSFYATQQQVGSDFVILGVNTFDSAADTRAFVRKQHLSYPVVLDQNQQAVMLYHVNATPCSYFIDRQGVIRAVVEAPLDMASLQRYVDQIDGW